MVSATSRLLSGVGCLALVVMMLWTTADVITRYFLSKPLQGSIDLVESTLVLVVFLALPECFRRNEQVTVDLVDHFVNARAVEWLKRISTVATALFLVLLLYTGVQPLVDAWQFGDRKPDLPVPIFSLLGFIELSLALAVAVLAGKFIEQLRRSGSA